VDNNDSVQWLQKIAGNGNPVAQQFLGRAYEEGWLGLVKDKEQAKYWYQQAAKRNPASTN
jgi:TPR repeat protein